MVLTAARPRTLRTGVAAALCALWLAVLSPGIAGLDDAAALLKSRQLDALRHDWESRDAQRYLAHYSQRFQAGEQDYRAWAAHKRRVNASKQWIRVGLSHMAMFRYPRERDFVVVAFDQDYRSSNLSNRMRKVQYWVREEGRWKIIYEGAAGCTPGV